MKLEKTALTPRRSQNKHVQFSPTSHIPAPEKQTRAKPRQFVTIDGKILTPINLSPGAKKDNIKKSYRSDMERTIFHPGPRPSRATKMDQKRSEEVKNTRQDTEKDQAQSSSTVKPIAQVVSRLRGKKGGVNTIENQKLRVFFSQSSISSFENSIVQLFDNHVKDLSFEKLGILISEKERERERIN